MTREQYGQRLASLTRQDLLKLCRAGGFAAGKVATNAELIDLLFAYYGHRAK